LNILFHNKFRLFIAFAVWITIFSVKAEDHKTIGDEDLQFIIKPPAKPLYKHTTHITISQATLNTGWVINKQCHYNLDQVSALEVVFRKGGVRKLKIQRADNIKRAWVEGSSVQLEDIGANAVLCIRSETQSFRRQPLDNSYIWRGGPYMKRFFDGYFPMHVNVAIDYPSQQLKLTTIEPKVLKARAVSVPGHIRIDTMFEGKLIIQLRFIAAEKKNGIGWN